MEIITDIQNPASGSIHICYSNVDSKGFSMCHGTVVLIKINALNLRNFIFTVECKKHSYIRTVASLNTWNN